MPEFIDEEEEKTLVAHTWQNADKQYEQQIEVIGTLHQRSRSLRTSQTCKKTPHWPLRLQQMRRRSMPPTSHLALQVHSTASAFHQNS